MTNEEIEQKADETLARIEDVPADWIRESAVAANVPVVAEAMRELAAQAYEDAAGVFEKMCFGRTDLDGRPFLDYRPACGLCLYCQKAKEVRALKPQIEVEPVASR